MTTTESKYFEVYTFKKPGSITSIVSWDGVEDSIDVPIAEINDVIREITYIDVDAKTDPKAQAVIINHIDKLNELEIDNYITTLSEIAVLKRKYFIRYRNQFTKTSIPVKQIIEHWKEIESQLDWYDLLLKSEL